MQGAYTGSGVFSLIKEPRTACLRWHEGHAQVRAVGQALFVWERFPVTTRRFSLWGCSLVLAAGGTQQSRQPRCVEAASLRQAPLQTVTKPGINRTWADRWIGWGLMQGRDAGRTAP